MSKILVWDLPTRLFHWLLVVGLIVTYAIAQFAGEHSNLFSVHMIVGIVLGFMVVLRLIWGIVGTKYARLSSFQFGPSALRDYFKAVFAATEQRSIGHNPASSYSSIAMLILVGLTVATGLLMSSGSEAAEELHAASAYALLAVIAVHIVGVVWYTLRHRENITLSMITGTKMGLPADAIRSSRPLAALVFVVAVASLTVSLFRNYEPDKRETKLPILGAMIKLDKADHDRDGRGASRDHD